LVFQTVSGGVCEDRDQRTGEVPPGTVPLPMLDLEPSAVQEVGAF
jgi:hypothetical protein